MNLTLLRKDFLETGIFGELYPDDESFSLKTLEHAYLVQYFDGVISFEPKIPTGSYTCQRGLHQLYGMAEPFETFEILGVPGHSHILFHVGNTNGDSEGCVLVGLFRSANQSIMQSKAAFDLFMTAQEGINEFILTVANGIVNEGSKNSV